MATMTERKVTTQVYQVFIKATPEAVWKAITDPEWNGRYGYGAPGEYDLRKGGRYSVKPSDVMAQHGAPDVILQGEILEVDPPRKLVQTWHVLWDPEMAAEGATRVTWEIDETAPGATKLTVTHDLERAPKVAKQVAGEIPEAGGGWAWILSDLKTLLETGAPIAS